MIADTVSMIIVKKLSSRYNPFTLTAMQVLGGLIFFLPGAWGIAHTPACAWSADLLLIIMGLGAFVTLGAFGLYNWGMSRITASRASAFIYLTPVTAVIVGWFFLNETLTKGQCMAACVVIAGVMLSESFPRGKKQDDNSSHPFTKSLCRFRVPVIVMKVTPFCGDVPILETGWTMTQRLLYEYCDVLIVGSGLAGIRAGISALGENSRQDVLMVSAGEGPTGSSFTNVNNALGILVCHDDREKEAFYETAIRIAAPGMIDPGLVRILAEESSPLFEDLLRSGLTFRRGDNGALVRYPGCFMPEQGQAYVFTDLGSAYDRMKKRFEGAGGRFAGGWILVDLITDDTGHVSGALFHNGLEIGRASCRERVS
jgi:uncharacterized membrane protein